MNTVILSLVTAASAFFILLASRPLAFNLKLVDTPKTKRNIHTETTPLTGGIVIFLASLVVIFNFTGETYKTYILCSTFTMLFTVGALDDIKHIRPSYRLIVQVFAASIITIELNLSVNNLDYLFSESYILLDDWSIPFTIFAIVGLINAFNMIDGLNGLAGSISLIALVSLNQIGGIEPSTFWVFCSTIIVFLLFNLGFLGYKRRVFLGDSGSTLLGLIIAWLLLETHNNPSLTTQVTATSLLCLVALPVIDIIAVMIRRASIGYSIFVADKKHLHHILLLLNHNKTTALLLLSITSVIFSILGLYKAEFGLSDANLISLLFLGVITHLILLKTAHLKYLKRNRRKNKVGPK